MDTFHSLLFGFSTALQPIYLLYALAGTILGTITGVLPGVGPLGAMAILLSFTLNMDAMGAMVLFAGIYYGAMYGGSTTSILLNIPGEAASVVTCIDGYKMAQKGRAGAALFVSAVGSFIAGTIGILGLTLAAPALANVALMFGPPEFLAIGLCGLGLLIRISKEAPRKSFIMVILGMAVTTVGVDLYSGVERFTFGVYELGQGIDFLPVAMGLFGLAEVLTNVAESGGKQVNVIRLKFKELLPTREEIRRSVAPILRGSLIGFPIGLIPGPSTVISTFVSYFTEKKLSRHPEEFGHGAIEGVAGPESANNAAVGGAYVPLLALGVPFTPAMAMVLGALMLHNVTPGPSMISEKPEIFWGIIASMYIGNFMLLILNIPFINLFSSIMSAPRQILMPVIVILCWVGVYSINSSYVDLVILAIFGVIGFGIRKSGYDPAMLVIAMVIGPMVEVAFRQSLKMTGGNIGEVISRPICMLLYLITTFFIVLPLIMSAYKVVKCKAKSY
ncbi:MAG: tripartite tricarboxylate transporter permease [Desulfocucumaceae bacterium]